MVRRLKAVFDQRQLGLFGEGLALGVKPTVVKVLPPAPLSVVRPTIDLPRKDAVPSTPASEVETPSKPKRLTSLPPEIVRPPEAASLLSVSLSLLKKWRIGGGGPRFVRLGGRAIGYRRADLYDWIEGRTR
jgi:predicted DNA-binding transcriptional regulator AlpA